MTATLPNSNVYRDSAGQWQWRLRDKNGLIIAESAEGYQTREGAEEAICTHVHRSRRRWALTIVVAIYAGVFLPLGEATNSLNLLLAPLAAGLTTALLARQGRLGTRSAPVRLGCLAAALTFTTMLVVVFFSIVWHLSNQGSGAP